MAKSRARAAGSAGQGRRGKNRPAGMPDPGAVVVALTPEVLLDNQCFMCYVCNMKYKRPQNLRYHMRTHQLEPEEPPQRGRAPAAGRDNRRRVFICPEPSCEYHDPRRALGDVTGIKKHYGRKHGHQKNWECGKCPKKYAVESDWKAHVKICDGSSSSAAPRRPLPQPQPFPPPSNGMEVPGWFTEPPPPPPPLFSAPARAPLPDLNLFPENPSSGMQQPMAIPESIYGISDDLPISFTDFLMADDQEGIRGGPAQLELFPIAEDRNYQPSMFSTQGSDAYAYHRNDNSGANPGGERYISGFHWGHSGRW